MDQAMLQRLSYRGNTDYIALVNASRRAAGTLGWDTVIQEALGGALGESDPAGQVADLVTVAVSVIIAATAVKARAAEPVELGQE